MSTKMDYDVLVVGAGPVGLMLATELQLAGVRVVVIERWTELDTASKAGAINTASAEAFEWRDDAQPPAGRRHTALRPHP